MHRVGICLILGLLVVCGVVFAIAPELDLAASHLFFDARGGFVGITPTGEMVRKVGYIVPFGLFAGAIVLWLARFAGFRALWLPRWRAIAFLVLTLALGPGLLVNTVLKDNSHRPRPVQTAEFGGPHAFRPWFRFDGGCVRNCSFVSGEASTGFWTLAPALLAPPQIRAAAIAAALAFGSAVAALRMAFGGHYFSDSLFSALLTMLIVLAAHRFFYARRRKPEDPDAGREAPRQSVPDPDLRRDAAPL